MTPGIEVSELTVRYGTTTALDRLSFRLDGGKIHGLIGRNGSGKTSLLSVLAGFRQASSGVVRVGGEEPFEQERITRQICLIREGGDIFSTEKVRDVLALARTRQRRCWPGWRRCGWSPADCRSGHPARGPEPCAGCPVQARKCRFSSRNPVNPAHLSDDRRRSALSCQRVCCTDHGALEPR